MVQLKENEEDLQKASISQFLGGFQQRYCKRLKENTNKEGKMPGLVVNACAYLAGSKAMLRGITIDASIWAKNDAVSCRVGLYKLRKPGKEIKNYFHKGIPMANGDNFGWGTDNRRGFARDFSMDTDMAVIDYGEMKVVKEAILDLQCSGTGASDNRRIKWDVLINGGEGEMVAHDEDGFPKDALYLFSYHLNRNVETSFYYGSMIYYGNNRGKGWGD